MLSAGWEGLRDCVSSSSTRCRERRRASGVGRARDRDPGRGEGGGGGDGVSLVLSAAAAPEQWLGHHRQPGVERDGGRRARRMVSEEPGVNNPGAERGVEGAAA